MCVRRSSSSGRGPVEDLCVRRSSYSGRGPVDCTLGAVATFEIAVKHVARLGVYETLWTTA